MLPGALIPMSMEWLTPFLDSGLVVWRDKEKRYTFTESGATLSFGYLDSKDDHLRYQGSEFQFIGFDEVTHINPDSYTYLFSRMRRTKNKQGAPLRVRATANPGGTYGEYYYNRFFVDNPIIDGVPKRVFLQAGMNDNPHLDSEEYRQALAELDPITRDQLENGNWEIRAKGDLFNREWLLSVDYLGMPEYRRKVRFWDLAAIDPKYRKKNTNTKEPDWTIGFLLSMANGCYYIEDIIRFQKTPGETEQIIYDTAVSDGYSCAIRMEEEGGASGIANTERYSRVVLRGFDYQAVKPVVSKIERARPVASACQVGNVFISNRCRELLAFYAQLDGFPCGAHDDIIDAFSGAFAYFKNGVKVMAPPRRWVDRQDSRLNTGNRDADTYQTNPSRSGSVWFNDMRR